MACGRILECCSHFGGQFDCQVVLLTKNYLWIPEYLFFLVFFPSYHLRSLRDVYYMLCDGFFFAAFT